MAEEKKESVITAEQHEAVLKELAECKAAYDDLANAFNKLLKDYNDLHVASLFKK